MLEFTFNAENFIRRLSWSIFSIFGNESSTERKLQFRQWNFRSWERKFSGIKVPVTQTTLSTELRKLISYFM